MSKMTNYYGSISVMATLNDDPIKVSNYSKVGKQQAKVGVSYTSPMELSNHLVSLTMEMKTLADSLSNSKDKGNDSLDNFYDLDANYTSMDLEFAKKYFAFQESDTMIFDSLPNQVRYIIQRYTYHSPVMLVFRSKGKMKTTLLKSEMDSLFGENFNLNKKEEIRINSSLLEKYQQLKKQTELCIGYMQYFKGLDKENKDLILRLLGLDELGFNDLETNLISLKTNIQLVDTISPENFTQHKNAFERQKNLVTSKVNSFNSKVKNAISKYIKFERQLRGSEENVYANINKESTRNSLAVGLGEIIYNRLFLGVIDLRESRAKAGNLLKIWILWYPNGAASVEPKQLDLASFEIKEVGWVPKIGDSFFLIDRFDSPEDPNDNESPTNYKGAAGVSMYLIYGNNKYKNNLLKRLQPSLGINLSYLDFQRDKDFEIGVGFVLGLFRNNLQATIGHNLHASSKGLYWGLGLSFSNLANQVKGNAVKP